MAILAFQKPDKVIMIESGERYGKFEFRPLEPGYGITIGNALRRILLSSLEGYAITTIKLDGVDHEFSTIKGVIEDVTEIILNLKQIRFKKEGEDVESEKVNITIGGQEEFTAGDINKFMTGLRILNPKLVICRMEPDVKLHLEMTISKGRGYIPAAENKPAEAEFGVIPIDSIYTPITKVKYTVENYRVEQKTDYEKLVLEISNEEFDEEVLHMRQLLKTKLVDLDLSVRALNCLKAADVETLGELVQYNRTDLLKFRNFGKKSLTELDDLLLGMGLNFGMDIAKYKLDKD